MKMKIGVPAVVQWIGSVSAVPGGRFDPWRGIVHFKGSGSVAAVTQVATAADSDLIPGPGTPYTKRQPRKKTKPKTNCDNYSKEYGKVHAFIEITECCGFSLVRSNRGQW